MRRKDWVYALAATLVLDLLGACATVRGQQITARSALSTADAADNDPSSLELAELENRLREAVKKTLPSVVSFIGAAGVIVSPDGLILSQAHVTHPENAKPGDKTNVILHDGVVAEAELLGADRLYDLSALRLTKAGPYAFTPLAERDPMPGDGVLKMGYPGPLWFRRGRPPEVRLGMVLATTGDTFLVDCRLNGGDSGGPFFDLDGRVVGILKMATPVLDQPSQKALWGHNLGMVRGGWWWRATAASLIRTHIERIAKGEIITTPGPAPAEGAVDESVVVHEPILQRQLIAEERRTQGNSSLGGFRRAVAEVRKSVVEILDDKEVVALGTVVDAGGLVITKASELPDDARCRLPGGSVLPAEVVGLDPAYDLVLVRVDAAGLVPLTWVDTADVPAGTLLAAAGTGDLPVARGIVSIPRRDTPGPHPAVPFRYQRKPAVAPHITGSIVEGLGYQIETSSGRAADCGVRPGDVLVSIAGATVSPPDDMKSLKRDRAIPAREEAHFTFRGLGIFEDRHAGDRVPVKLLRKGEQIELSLELEGTPDSEARSDVESHQDKAPPIVITTDMPVLPHECGGPAVDIHGQVVGLVISRFGPTGSFVIPADVVAARLADLRVGKPLSSFPIQSERHAGTAPGSR